MFLFAAFMVVSCEKEPEPLTTNSVITGTARVFSSSGYDGPYNIRVDAIGPYGRKSVITDEDDGFTITGMGNGTYYLDYSKEGFGTIRRYGIQLFGNDTVKLGTINLFEKVDKYFTAPEFIRAYAGTMEGSNPDITWICIETSIRSGGIPMMLFMDTESDVSYNSYICAYPTINGGYNDEGRLVIYVDTRYLSFKSGDEVFLIGYICNRDEWNNGYFDTYHGIKQYSTLEKNKYSNRISFIMP